MLLLLSDQFVAESNEHSSLLKLAAGGAEERHATIISVFALSTCTLNWAGACMRKADRLEEINGHRPLGGCEAAVVR